MAWTPKFSVRIILRTIVLWTGRIGRAAAAVTAKLRVQIMHVKSVWVMSSIASFEYELGRDSKTRWMNSAANNRREMAEVQNPEKSIAPIKTDRTVWHGEAISLLPSLSSRRGCLRS